MRTLATVLLCVLLLAGCSSTPASPTAPPTTTPSAAVSETPTPTPTPTATQEQETGESAPAAPFGGSCEAAFGDGPLAALTDLPVSEVSPWLDIDNIIFRQGGGLVCTSSEQKGTFVQLAVIAANAVDSVDQSVTCVKGGLEWGPKNACFTEVVQNGFRLSGVIAFRSGSLAANTPKAQALVDGFTGAAAGSTAPPTPIPADGAWQLPLNCSGIDAALDEKSEFKNKYMKAGHGRGGTDVFVPPAITEFVGSYDEPLSYCGWHGTKALSEKQLAAGGIDYFVFTAAGGAAWAFDEIRASYDTTEISIPGVERAMLVDETSYGNYIYVADGPNLIYGGWTDGDGADRYAGLAKVVNLLNEDS